MEIFVAFDAAAMKLGHHEIPRESDTVPLALGRVVLADRVLEELLGVRVGLVFVDGGKDDGGDLEEGDDNDEQAVRRQQDAGFLDGAAVPEEADNENERARRDQDISTLLDHRRLG